MGEAGTQRRALVASIAIGTLAVVGILGGTAWGLAVATASDGLRIAYGVQPVTCDGARVGSVEVDASSAPGLRGAIVELTPGMRCAIHVQLVNDGWADVTVQTVALPGMANGGGIGLKPCLVSPNGMRRVETSGRDHRNDAVFTVDGLVAPAGSTTTFEAPFEWTASNSISPGGWIGLAAPAIGVSAFGHDWRIESGETDMIFYTLPLETPDASIHFP